MCIVVHKMAGVGATGVGWRPAHLAKTQWQGGVYRTAIESKIVNFHSSESVV